MASLTNFCCRSGGDNRSAGTRTGSTTEPGTSPDFQYASGSWVSATRVFTVASGNPLTDGVAVGDFGSIYPDGTTGSAVCIARVTAVTSTTITFSGTALAGTSPADGTSNRTVRIGGAWAGPSGSSGFPLNFGAGSLTNAAGDPVRIWCKNDQTYAITAAISAGASAASAHGYASAYGDGGRAILDGGTTGASYILFTAGASSSSLWYDSWEFRNNGATGSSAGVSVASSAFCLTRSVVRDVRGTGLNLGSGVACVAAEVEVYGANQSNTASLGGVVSAGGLVLDRCTIHDNAGSNTSGVRLTSSSAHAISRSVFDSNGSGGGLVSTGSSSAVLVSSCDFYNNAGPGLSLGGSLGRVVDCNFLKGGGYGIAGASFAGRVFNCGFGTGTQANASGNIQSTAAEETGTVTYASGVTPWQDPANGDFRITLAAAKGTGRGTFTQTQSGYTGTVAYPDIGAGQSNGGSGGGVSRARVTNGA